MARDTVEMETPQALATSWIVAMAPLARTVAMRRSGPAADCTLLQALAPGKALKVLHTWPVER
ncbi:hypothetical protein GCM10009608_13850 [Pseudonocardia alaniniphila]